MFVYGKRSGRSSVAALATGHRKQRLFFILNELSDRQLLVDTGAEVSVFPGTRWDVQSGRFGPQLCAANGSTIRTFGKRKVNVSLNSRRFTWEFVIADVSKPLLRADFFCHFGLLVDVRRRRLLDAASVAISALQPTTVHMQRLYHVANQNHYTRLLARFPQLVTPSFSAATTRHGVEHYISTTGTPVHSRARRLPPEKLALAKTEFRRMEDMGIIRPSNSPWSSPLHMVPKQSGGWRPCGDYRRLNSVTIPDRYPVPHLQDFAANLAGTCVFSKVDLVRGYHQIAVKEEVIPKTAVITPFGLYEFLRMPFGLKNAAQTFQRLMDSVCRGLQFVFVYLDDILIASNSHEEHLGHLRLLFERLQQHGLVINSAKCTFGSAEIDFLGHRVTGNGARPLPDKVQAIREFAKPPTTRGLQQFLGMINFYRRFVPAAAAVLQPLFGAAAAKDKYIRWTSDMDTAFHKAKMLLADATMLCHPVADAPTALTVDASDLAVGAVLEQMVDNSWRPLAFYSRHLRKAECKYSAFDRELLALYLATRHFRYFLEGREFVAYSDHKPLTLAITKISDPWSPRQQRHLTSISEYTTDIRHIAGKHNFVADTLSRPGLDSVFTEIGVDFSAMAAAQQADTDTISLVTGNSGLILRQMHFGTRDDTILCDVSTGHPRPIVPESFRRQVFDIIHDLSHPGVRATCNLVTNKFVWKGVRKQVSSWTKSCVACQLSKVQRHVRSPLTTFEVPQRRFDHLHVDLVGPMPPSQGCTYLFTVVDRFTRWPEAIPLTDISTQTCARAFVRHWIARFGVPVTMTSDRGPQFTSQLWSALTTLLGTIHQRTTAYHPQANGLVERFHRSLKSSLRARLTGPNWMDELPWILLGIRTAPKEDLDASSAELVYGSPLTVPGDFVATQTSVPAPETFLSKLRDKVANLTPIPTTWHGTKASAVPIDLHSSKFVFVRRDAHRSPLQRPYEGPYKVLSVKPKFFTIDMGGRAEVISIDRLKPAHLDVDQPVHVALPRRRGRPPKICVPTTAGSGGSHVAVTTQHEADRAG